MTEDPGGRRDGEQAPGEGPVQPPSPWAATPTPTPTPNPAGADETGPVSRPTEAPTLQQPAAGSWQPQQPPASGGWGQPTGPQSPQAGQWGQPPAGQPPVGQWGPPPAGQQPPPGQWGQPPTGQQPPPGWQGAGGPQGPGGPPPGGFGTSMPSYPSQPKRSRGKGKAFVGIAVGTVLALAAGAFAVTSFGDDAPSSPEAAVEALFAAVEQRDVLGVLDTMAPDEREVYQPFIEDVVSELTRLEVLSDDIDLGAVSGVELDVEGLELESEELGDGVSVVTVTGGTITSTVDPEEVPVGSFIRDLMEDPENEVDMDVVSETADLVEGEPAELVVIDDGGWHVSLHYSIAEAARKEAGAPVPDFGEGVQPDGADSPEAAVEELVQASVDLDLRRVIELLPPGEMAALHDYAPIFLDDVDEAVEDLRSEADFEISVDELDTEVDEDGDIAKVKVTGFAVSGQADGEDFEAAYDGECFTGTFDGEEEELCLDDEDLGMDSAFVQSAFDASLTVLTVEEGGEWFVTPIRTFMEYGLVVLRALDAEALEDPEAFFGDLFGFDPYAFGTEGFGPDGLEEDLSFDEDSSFDEEDPYAECSAFYDDLPADATDEEYDEAGAAYDACFDEISGIDPGSDPADVCSYLYDDLPADATPEQIAEADDAYSLCFDDAAGPASAPNPFEECSYLYDDLPPDATPEQVAEVDAAYESCYDSVAGGDPAEDAGCYEAYSSLPDEPTDQEFDDADAAFEACVEASEPE